MKKETINWLENLIDFRKEWMEEHCDTHDPEVLKAVKAENEIADQFLKQLEKLKTKVQEVV